MTQTDQNKAASAHGRIVARAWRDPAFKAKLLADPHAALKEAGVAVPQGVTVKVVENSASHFHLVLPPMPTGELSDGDLDKVAGGFSFGDFWDGVKDAAGAVKSGADAVGHAITHP